MKNFYFTFFFIFSWAFISCENIMLNDETVSNSTSEPNTGTRSMVSPILGKFSKSNPALYNNWETVTTIYLNNGNTVDAPWVYASGNSMNIPYDFRTDIKKEDGWSMLGHTMEVVNIEEPNYMLFYHKKSGVLKGFYFSHALTPNQNAKWIIQSDKPSSIIPESSKVYHLSGKAIQHSITSNIVKSSIVSSIGALNYGWNCFTFELPYGEINNQAAIIDILGYNVHNFEITANGSLAGQVVVPSTSTSNSLDSWKNFLEMTSNFTGAANTLGGLYKKKTSSKSLHENVETRSVIGAIGIISAAVSAVSSIVKGASFFTSKTKNVTHRYNFSGGIELTGSAIAQLGGAFHTSNDIEINKLNNNEPLGVWGLKELPKLEMKKYSFFAYLSRMGNGPGNLIADFDTPPSIDSDPININELITVYNNINLKPSVKKEWITINPTLLPLIKDYKVSVGNVLSTASETERLPGLANKYEKIQDGWYCVDIGNGIYRNKISFRPGGYVFPPTTKHVNFYTSYIKGAFPKTYISVTLEIEYNDGSVFASSRVFEVNASIYDNKQDLIKSMPKDAQCIFL